MVSNSEFSVVIAGGGFCGILTLINLIRKANRHVSITIINSGYPIACGVAFKTYSDKHLLNVEARNMSAFADEPDHFVEWCRNNQSIDIDDEEIPTTYFPRNIYGLYLEEIFSNSISEAGNHVSINIIDDEVVDIHHEKKTFDVITGGGKKIRADKIILATGNSEPGPPVLNDPAFLNSPNYFSNPWCESAVNGLKNNEDVLIIGGGLTMVDVIIGLREKNFKGKIISLSPHGFNILPHRKAPPQRYILDELSPPYDLETLFRLFYKHIRQARKHGQSGETVVDAIRAKTQEIWKNLSLVDKKKFMAHLRHLWGVARHRLPAEVHEGMKNMIREKKLEVIAGRIQKIRECEKGIEVIAQSRKDQTEFILNVSRVINCTGPQTDIRKQNSKLYDSLLKKGMVRPDEMNLGIDASDNYEIIKSDNTVNKSLFAIGSLLKGKLWESTAVPELRIQAARVADFILSDSVNS